MIAIHMVYPHCDGIWSHSSVCCVLPVTAYCPLGLSVPAVRLHLHSAALCCWDGWVVLVVSSGNEQMFVLR